MRIAMIQMASASGDVEKNISRAFSMMEEAAEKSDLLVLPELWTIGYNKSISFPAMLRFSKDSLTLQGRTV